MKVMDLIVEMHNGRVNLLLQRNNFKGLLTRVRLILRAVRQWGNSMDYNDLTELEKMYILIDRLAMEICYLRGGFAPTKEEKQAVIDKVVSNINECEFIL